MQSYGICLNHFRQFEFMTDAVDGLLIRIEAPKRMKKDEPILNKTQYFSGSKISFGINMQAACDANIKFTAVACKHVGSTNGEMSIPTLEERESAVSCGNALRQLLYILYII